MKNLLLLLSCFLFPAFFASSQAPVVSWQKSFGGSAEDLGQCVEATADGGLIIGGTTYSTNGDLKKLNHGPSKDFWIIRLNNDNSIQWSKAFGGSDNEVLSSIQQTSDGGYIAAGAAESADGDLTEHEGTGVYSDLWIVKLKANGKIEWQKSMGSESLDFAKSVQQTTDGGYVVAGCTENEYWIVKFDASGNVLWEKMYGGSSMDVATCIQQTINGGYIVAGYSYSGNKDVTGHHGTIQSSDYWIIHLDASGNLLWERSFGGNANDVPNSMAQGSDGTYLVAGYTFSTEADVENNHGGADYWLIKISDDGELLWQQTYGGSNDDIANSIQVLNDGGFSVAGSSRSGDGDVSIHLGSGFQEDFWVLTTDASGNIVMENTFGGNASDIANGQYFMPDGTQYIIGSSSSTDQDAVGNMGGMDLLLLQLGTVPVNTISLPLIADNKPCWGDNFSIDFTTTGTFNPGNIFTAEITKKENFTKKISIGSAAGISSGQITATIPYDMSKGTHSLRIISSDPPIISDALMSDLHLKCPGIPNEGKTTSGITATSAVISWQPSGGCPISYQVKYRISSGNASDNIYADVSEPTYTLTGLTPGTEYIWQVATRCVESPELLSNYSLVRDFTTKPLRLGNEVLQISQVEISPNPATSLLTITSATGMAGTLQIINSKGQILTSQLVNASEAHLDVSAFPSGLYMLVLISGTETFIKKFVKE